MNEVIRSPRVVASYTTIPSRYNELKRSMLTLKEQTHQLDCIYLTIPHKMSRLNKEYPPLPDDLAALCTVVRTEVDYGPLTKIVGALTMEADPDTVIISCDDDVSFASDHVEVLLKHHATHPKSAICGTGALIARGVLFMSIVSTVQPFQSWSGFTGFDVDKKGRRVDLIFGVAGVLYTRDMFPTYDLLHQELLRYSLEDENVFLNDDVLISGYLSKQGIERRIFLDIPTIHHDGGADALSADFFKMINRLGAAIQKVKENGFFPTMEESSLDETPTGRVFITVIVLTVIIVLSVFLYQVL